MLAVDVPRRGAADGRGVDPERPPRDRPGGLRRGELGPDRDVAPGAGAVLRRRRAGRRRGLPADARDDDARAARSVRAWGWDLLPDRDDDRRRRRSGSAARTSSSRPSSSRVARSCGSRASFYVGRPAKLTGSLEFHGDDASLALGSFQDFDATVEIGAVRRELRARRPGSAGVSRHGVGTRRRRDGGRHRRGPTTPSERRAGRPRRRHPRGGRAHRWPMADGGSRSRRPSLRRPSCPGLWALSVRWPTPADRAGACLR